MGAGKSTVGRLVAARLAWPLVDSDRAIEERTGSTVRELWQAGGEDAYRRLESDVVIDALVQRSPSVIAAPGGIVLDPRAREAMQASFVIWLRADPHTLAGRVGCDDHRPLLGDDPATVLTRMATERAGLYADVADVVLDVEELDAERLAGLVLEHYVASSVAAGDGQ
jgi:shikimate kinase